MQLEANTNTTTTVELFVASMGFILPKMSVHQSVIIDKPQWLLLVRVIVAGLPGLPVCNLAISCEPSYIWLGLNYVMQSEIMLCMKGYML